MKPAPTYLSETRSWRNPATSADGAGFKSAAEVDAKSREHVCGNCRQPGTNKGRADCPGNKVA